MATATPAVPEEADGSRALIFKGYSRFELGAAHPAGISARTDVQAAAHHASHQAAMG